MSRPSRMMSSDRSVSRYVRLLLVAFGELQGAPQRTTYAPAHPHTHTQRSLLGICSLRSTAERLLADGVQHAEKTELVSKHLAEHFIQRDMPA